MKVVAVIPLYNGSAYIEGSLKSILSQSHPVDCQTALKIDPLSASNIDPLKVVS